MWSGSSSGYPLFLLVLLPFHSPTLIGALQALMGLGIGAIVAVLRHRGLPWWGRPCPPCRCCSTCTRSSLSTW